MIAEGPEFRVNTTTAGDQFSPAVAITANGSFVIVWESFFQDGSGTGIYGQRYTPVGEPVGSEFQVNVTTAGAQDNPSVAVGLDGQFVVAWQSVLSSGGTGIFFRLYDANGLPLTTETRVNTGSTRQSVPVVGMARGGTFNGRFVVAWQADGQDGDGGGVFFQRHAANSSPLGGSVKANLTTAKDQRLPALAVAPDFSFLLARESDGQDGSLFGIMARQFGSDGTALTPEVRGNQFAADNQVRPTVGLAANAALIAWESTAQDGSGTGIYAKSYRVTPGATGTFTVTPGSQQIRAGESVTLRFTWKVPPPRVWRDLDRLQLRLIDDQGAAIWLRWREADDRVVLVDLATEQEGASGLGGSAGQLAGPAATLDLAGTRARGSGPTGQQVDLELPLTFLAAADARTFRIEVAASDDAGQGDDFEAAGTVRVGNAPPEPTATAANTVYLPNVLRTSNVGWCGQACRTAPGGQSDGTPVVISSDDILSGQFPLKVVREDPMSHWS